MSTINALVKQSRIKKYHENNVKALKGNPQKKGICVKIRIVKPKKPNSAQRKIVKVRLSKKRCILAYIPGQGHNLKSYFSVLISGGRANDLPGVRFSLIRGKYDFNFNFCGSFGFVWYDCGINFVTKESSMYCLSSWNFNRTRENAYQIKFKGSRLLIDCDINVASNNHTK